jgi:hypothetical protein
MTTGALPTGRWGHKRAGAKSGPAGWIRRDADVDNAFCSENCPTFHLLVMWIHLMMADPAPPVL